MATMELNFLRGRASTHFSGLWVSSVLVAQAALKLNPLRDVASQYRFMVLHVAYNQGYV